MYRHVNEEAPPPSTIRSVRPELEAIVMRCLAKDPRKRFASAADLEAALLSAPFAETSDTEPLVPVQNDAADTRPVAPLRNGVAGTRPIERRARPPWHERRPMQSLAVAGVLAFLGLAALTLASTNDELRPRQAAREAGRSVSAQIPESTPPSVAAAWTGLMDAIASGAASGGIDERSSEKLADRAVAILEAYGAGDEEELEKALGDLEDELAKGVESGEISADSAAGIDLAMLELLLALQDDGALTEVASQEATVIDEGGEEADEGVEGEGSGNEGHGDEDGGPPEHANDDKDEG